MKIEVWDSVMGSGKTSGIIDWMLSNQQNKYIYVSPFLTEAEDRIPVACDGMNFICPEVNGSSKSDHLFNLLSLGENISTTHALFKKMTKEHLKLIEEKEYILIIDECVDMIQKYGFNKGDFVNILDQGILEIDYEHMGRLIPKKELKAKTGDMASIVDLADKGILYASKNSSEALVTQLPPELLKSAKRTIILTYMFEGSLLAPFLELHGMAYTAFTEGHLKTSEGEVLQKVRSLLTVASTPSVDALAKNNTLSVTWYKNAKGPKQESLRNAVRSVARKHNTKDYLFTTFKDYKPYLETKGKLSLRSDQDKPEDNTFLIHTVRATNDYRDKKVMAYCLEKNPDGTICSYFGSYGISVDRDKFALSEMLQWLWRGCIRDGKAMTVYIFSDRMKSLLNNWLNDIESEPESLLEAA